MDECSIARTLTEASGAGGLRLAEWPARAWSPFVELGAGINLLSHAALQPARVFSTAFQFGELGGVGVRFGTAGAYELGLRVQHISYGGIKQPNDGITFVVVRLACQFP